MNFVAALQPVYNRGPEGKKDRERVQQILMEMIAWVILAPIELFQKNEAADIFTRVKPELGPYEDDIHRKAVILEVLRVLGLFESGLRHSEGEDVSRRTMSTPENKEAGAWQESYDCRKLSSDIQTVLHNAGIMNGHQFQEDMKKDHELSMLVATMLLRLDMSNFNRIPNGPLRKGDERKKTWPDRPKLWKAEESIYPWLSRQAVSEFRLALTE